jgi:hypothetical protein
VSGKIKILQAKILLHTGTPGAVQSALTITEEVGVYNSC